MDKGRNKVNKYNRSMSTCSPFIKRNKQSMNNNSKIIYNNEVGNTIRISKFNNQLWNNKVKMIAIHELENILL